MTEIQRTKIEILRFGSVVDSTIFGPDEMGENAYTMSSTRSVNAFPTLSVKSSDPNFNELLMNFSKKDIIRLSISTPDSDDLTTFFEGEFKTKTVSFTKETNNLSIEMDAIHSFYGLSMMQLSPSFDFSSMTFGEFVREIVLIAGIQSQVTIEKELSSRKIVGTSHRTNLYRLFKEVCLFLNASVSFNPDNSVEIDYRSKKIAKIRAQKPITISKDDCINFQFNDQT